MHFPDNQCEFLLTSSSDLFCLDHFLPKWSAKVCIPTSLCKCLCKKLFAVGGATLVTRTHKHAKGRKEMAKSLLQKALARQ
jgi:hypothetical protein